MKLCFETALQRTELLAPTVQRAIKNIGKYNICVAEIDPKYMGGSDLCKYYDIPEHRGANCVIVEGIRGQTKTFAACLVPVSCERIDFNGIVRKYLNARRVSLAPLDIVLRETGMEYGSITALGLPKSWKILIDPTLLPLERIVLGSGLQKSKLSLPGKALLHLPHSHVLEGLCKERQLNCKNNSDLFPPEEGD